MKFLTTIFLLVLLVSIQTPIGQLFKLPLLIEHFIKHQKQDGVSLFSFLEDHYVLVHNDADRQEDERLPFKNISFYSISYEVVPFFKHHLTQYIAEKRHEFVDVGHTHTSDFPSAVWQPPKSC